MLLVQRTTFSVRLVDYVRADYITLKYLWPQFLFFDNATETQRNFWNVSSTFLLSNIGYFLQNKKSFQRVISLSSGLCYYVSTFLDLYAWKDIVQVKKVDLKMHISFFLQSFMYETPYFMTAASRTEFS